MGWYSRAKNAVKEWLGFIKVCPQCDARNDASAIYCKECSARVGPILCECGATVPASAKFCKKCRRDGSGQEAPSTVEVKGWQKADGSVSWPREEDAIVQRQEAAELLGILKKGLIIEEGTVALLMQDGAYIGSLGPGRHLVESLKGKLSPKCQFEKRTTYYLYDPYDLLASWKAGPFTSKGFNKWSCGIECVVRLEDPSPFLHNVMKGKPQFKQEDLEAFVEAPVQDALQAVIAGLDDDEIARFDGLSKIEAVLLERLQKALRDSGFIVKNFRLLRLTSPFLDQQTEKKVTYTQRISDKRLDFDHKIGEKKLDNEQGLTEKGVDYDHRVAERKLDSGYGDAFYDLDLADRFKGVRHLGDDNAVRREEQAAKLEGVKGDLDAGLKYQEVVQEGALGKARLDKSFDLESLKVAADLAQQRLPALDFLLKGQNLDKMARLRTDDEWEAFRQEVDKGRAIRDDEWQRLRSALAARQVEEGLKRDHAQSILREMQRAELDELEVVNKYRQRAIEMEKDGTLSEKVRDEETKQLRHELEQRQKVEDDTRKRREAEFTQSLSEQERMAELQRQKQLGQLDPMKALKEIEQWEEDKEFERAERRKDMESDRERQRVLLDSKVRIDTMEAETASTVRRQQSADATRLEEARIKASLPLQLAQLGLSPLQIVGLMSNSDPSVLAKLAETAAGQDAQPKILEMYERMLKQQGDSKEELKSAMQGHQASDDEKFRQVIQTQQVMANAGAQRQSPPVTVVQNVDSQPAFGWCEKHCLRFNAARGCPACASDQGK
jgi:ribosomal protein L40E